MSELYYMTKQKEKDLRLLGYQYVCVWEHEFYDQMRNDADMKEYVSKLEITDRLRPRDSFFGGRTNAIKLYHEVKEPNETIEYFDFTRLVFLKNFIHVIFGSFILNKNLHMFRKKITPYFTKVLFF